MKKNNTKLKNSLRLKKYVNPFLFMVSILMGAFVLSDLGVKAYSGVIQAGYVKKADEFPQTSENLQSELTKTNMEIEYLSETLKINDMLIELTGSRYSESDRMRYALVIAEETARYDIDPSIILAIVAAESSFRTTVVSHKGAIGLMQLLPSTAFYMSKKVDHINIKETKELFDAETNLRLGVAYFAYLIEKTGSLEHAVIAYNYGPGNLKKAINKNAQLPKKYISSVMTHYKRINKYDDNALI